MFKISFFWKSLTFFIFLALGNIGVLSAVTFDIVNEGMPEKFSGHTNFRLRVAEAKKEDLEKSQKEVQTKIEKIPNKIVIPAQQKTSCSEQIYHLNKELTSSSEELKSSYLSFLLTADHIATHKPIILNCWTGHFRNLEKNIKHITIHIKDIYNKTKDGISHASLQYYLTSPQEPGGTGGGLKLLDFCDLFGKYIDPHTSYIPFEDKDEAADNFSSEGT